MRTALIIAGTLLLAVPGTAALAHDGDYYQDYFDHQRDHLEHEQFHQQFRAEHGAAHDEGFSSPAEHEAWHRAYQSTHGEFHHDHPNTWHDHGYSGYGGYYPAYNYGAYNPYWWWYRR